jgi:hypothetical protein
MLNRLTCGEIQDIAFSSSVGHSVRMVRNSPQLTC